MFPAKFPDLHALLAPAVVERLVLLINHVLGAEPQASQRLRLHAGKRLQMQLQAWPQWLPALPPLNFCVTPAGLLEWQAQPSDAAGAGSAEPEPDLRVRLPASDAAHMAADMVFGRSDRALPPLEIDGDAQLATDVNWLAENLRWDVAGDLERAFGPAVAHELQRIGGRFTQGLGAMLRAAGDASAHWRSR